jgi:hypothetical protein
MDYIEKDKQQHQDKDGNRFWNFKHIVSHEGPFRGSDPEYKGSRYNILIEWENGEITSEPLNIFGKDDPVTCAVYAHEHGLLEEEGWKRFKGIVRHEKKMLRVVNQSRIKATRNAPRYKFGYRIPHNYDEVMQFDLKNGNTLWREATNLEMSQLAEYDTFRDLGHKDTTPPPTGYKKIRTHLVYDCKHDGRHKAWMVADGHLMDIPLESVYSGVCCCMNSSNEWNVQLGGTRHRRTIARATANKEWDSSFALSLCPVGNEALYTADQMIRRSDTLYSRRAITTRANTMTTMVHSIVHSND